MNKVQLVLGRLTSLFFLGAFLCLTSCGGGGETADSGYDDELDDEGTEQMAASNQGGGASQQQQQQSGESPRDNWYNTSIDGNQQIDEAIAKVRGSNKMVLVQVGGNWCPWCIKFANMIVTDGELLGAMRQNFEWVHLNTGEGNENQAALQRLRNPEQHGFPVFVLLDGEGNYVNTYPSDTFAGGDGFDRSRVLSFLQSQGR